MEDVQSETWVKNKNKYSFRIVKFQERMVRLPDPFCQLPFDIFFVVHLHYVSEAMFWSLQPLCNWWIVFMMVQKELNFQKIFFHFHCKKTAFCFEKITSGKTASSLYSPRPFTIKAVFLYNSFRKEGHLANRSSFETKVQLWFWLALRKLRRHLGQVHIIRHLIMAGWLQYKDPSADYQWENFSATKVITSLTRYWFLCQFIIHRSPQAQRIFILQFLRK